MPKTTLDGTEKILFENTELGNYCGYIFLDKLIAGDTVRLRAYLKDVEDEVYKLREARDFTGAQAYPCVETRTVVGKIGIKVTAQQTAGTYREISHMWFKR